MVNITADGTVHSGQEVVTVEELQREVVARVKADPNAKVYLRADAEAKHRAVKKVMNAMAEAGVDDFIFGVFIPSGQRGDAP